MMFKLSNDQDYDFELTLCVRDHTGNPTGQKKTYSTDSGYKLWSFLNRFQGRPKRRKKKKVQQHDKTGESNTEE